MGARRCGGAGQSPARYTTRAGARCPPILLCRECQDGSRYTHNGDSWAGSGAVRVGDDGEGMGGRPKGNRGQRGALANAGVLPACAGSSQSVAALYTGADLERRLISDDSS